MSKSKDKFEMTIGRGVLDHIKLYYLTLPHEICGNIIPLGENEQHLVNVEHGGMTGGRNSCRVKKYSHINFHTHPNGVKSYPSIEDMLGIIKPRHGMIEIIFTQWGIWKLSVVEQRSIDVGREIEFFSMASLELYSATDRGRSEFADIPTVVNFINIFERRYRAVGFRMTFTPWEDIENEYKF